MDGSIVRQLHANNRTSDGMQRGKKEKEKKKDTCCILRCRETKGTSISLHYVEIKAVDNQGASERWRNNNETHCQKGHKHFHLTTAHLKSPSCQAGRDHAGSVYRLCRWVQKKKSFSSVTCSSIHLHSTRQYLGMRGMKKIAAMD